MTNAGVAQVLERIAVMLELDGANSFRVRAYREGARVIEALTEPVAAIAAREENGLESLRGIGKDLAQKIRDVLASGSTALHDELQMKYPEELVRLTDLQGLGPTRVKQVFEVLGVRNRVDLEKAAREGKLRGLPRFGEKLEAKVLASLAVADQYVGRMLLSGAWPVAHALADHLKAIAGVEAVEIAGSFRRRRDTVGDLDFLVCGGAVDAVMDAFTSHPLAAEVLGRGDTKASVRLNIGLQADLRVVPGDSFGAALMYFTGSKAHNIELRRIAIEKGWSLNEYGLTKGETRIAGRTEEEIYRALGMDWIPPELREHQGEIALAREGKLPKLIEVQDLRGDLHMHTTRSDGKHSLQEMVRAAKERGYAYCAITEHSKSLAMAGGFNEARVRQSVDEIAEVRRQVPGIEVMHGLEVDILADGALDLEDDGLALLDWVIISLHSRLEQPREVVTERVLRALAHPRVCAMAHPSGRMIGQRPGADLDWERVFTRAAELGVAMEINAQPNRTDLNDHHARMARERGVRLVIDTDSHSMAQLENVRYGIFAARRAGVTKADVINTQPWERFKTLVRTAGGAGAVAKKVTTPVAAAAPGSDAKATPSAKRKVAKKPASPTPKKSTRRK